MYFASRTDAGKQLAEKLLKYRYENAIVVALTDGALLVGQEIAATLHCGLATMAVEAIDVPGESQTYGTVDHQGGFTVNREFSTGQLEEYYNEFHGMIDQQKLEKYQHLNRLLADGGLVDKIMVRHHVVILAADGLKDTVTLDAAAEFFKPVKVERLVVACPVASVEAVDRMHILADEIQCLGVTPNFFDTNHYYDINELPRRDQVADIISQNVLNWR